VSRPGSSVAAVRIALGTDEERSPVPELVAHLEGAGHEVCRVAPGRPWPEVGRAVGEAVATGAADVGVVCCWTGTGVSIAANKVPGVRAALCADAATAAGARRWNDANVLALSLRLCSAPLAVEIADAFLAGEPDPEELPLVASLEPGPASRDAPLREGGASAGG
jgi:ribose 5-phosphate isomerase B